MNIQITGMVRLADPKVTKNGDSILAYFDTNIEWLTLEGVALVKKQSGVGFTCFPPIEPRKTPYRRCCRLDLTVRHAITEKALSLFAALGGES